MCLLQALFHVLGKPQYVLQQTAHVQSSTLFNIALFTFKLYDEAYFYCNFKVSLM